MYRLDMQYSIAYAGQTLKLMNSCGKNKSGTLKLSSHFGMLMQIFLSSYSLLNCIIAVLIKVLYITYK